MWGGTVASSLGFLRIFLPAGCSDLLATKEGEMREARRRSTYAQSAKAFYDKYIEKAEKEGHCAMCVRKFGNRAEVGAL